MKRHLLAVLTQTEIAHRVTTVLVQSLGLNTDEIQPASRLEGDLGAESIDFLDIVFRLERTFGITIKRNELFPDGIFNDDPDFVQDGRVTESGLAELRAQLPFADPDCFANDLEVSRIGDLFTVDLLTRFIQFRLNPADEVTGQVQHLAQPA